MRKHRAVLRRTARTRTAVLRRNVVLRVDEGVLIGLTGLHVVVAGHRIAELTDGTGGVEPRLRRAVRSQRSRQHRVIFQRRAQRNEVHGAAERVASLAIGGAEPLGHVDAIECRDGKLGEIEIAGVAVVEHLAVERHQRFGRVRSAQRNDRRRGWRARIRTRNDDRRNLLQPLEDVVITKRIHLRTRDVHFRNDVAHEREPAVDANLADGPQFRRIRRLEHDVDARVGGKVAGRGLHRPIAAGDRRNGIAAGRNDDAKVAFRVGRRLRVTRAFDNRPAHWRSASRMERERYRR